MALDDTVGGADANAYPSLAYVVAYAAARPFSSAFSNADPTDQESFIIRATQLFDASFDWNGAAVSETQALCFPRSGLRSRNGFALATDAIPKAAKDAVAEWACVLATAASDPTADSDAEKQGVKRVKAGSVEVEFKTETGTDAESLDAATRLRGPEFNYLWRAVPDSVRVLIPASWYTRPSVSRPAIFEMI